MSSERGEYDVEGCPKLWEEELKLAEELKNCCELKEQSKMRREKKSDLDKSGRILRKIGLVYKRRALDFLWKLHFALSVINLIESLNTPITRDMRNAIPRIRTSIRFAFIRSAALINAAIVRECKKCKKIRSVDVINVEKIGKDLDEVHRLVLEVAKQTNKVANSKQFDYKLNEIVQGIKDKVDSFRSKTRKYLKKLDNIPENVSDEEVRERQKGKTKFMKKLQTLVSQYYADMIKYISSKVQQIMGNPPCRYAMVGMGSLAREEITPFSDFEHIILLEDEIIKNMNEDDDSVETEPVLEYFRWFCVVFFMVVLGLRETRLFNVFIPSLNNNQNKKRKWFYDDHTTSGISFDGMALYASHCPLGRQEKTKKKSWTTELIKPVTKMVKYLDEDEDIKDGYNLANILSYPCFVYGDKSVFEKFVELSSSKIDGSGKESFQSQLKKDLENFDVDEMLEQINGLSHQPIGIKEFMFRSSTLFISALGRIHLSFKDFVSTSPFEVIEKLLNRQVLTQAGAHELAYAVAISFEVRLKLYFEKKQQNDFSRNQFNIDEESQPLAPEIVNAIGKESFLDYIEIAQELQKTLKNRKENCKYQSTKNKVDIRIINALKLGLLKKQIQLYHKHYKALPEDKKISISLLVGQSCVGLGCTSDASKIFQKMWDHLSNLEKTFQENRKKELEVCLHKYKPACYIGLGICDYENGKYDSAIANLKKCEAEFDESLEPRFQYRGLAYGLISHCYVCKNELRAAKEYCEKTLEFMKNPPNLEFDCEDVWKEMEKRKNWSHNPVIFKIYRLLFMFRKGFKRFTFPQISSLSRDQPIRKSTTKI
ncbi:unnamed protein product [Clavelina lepadiformis]|uniref:Protein-PII uridylyltransferase N-terminal domain-containing protein n=1 Tax=Clavelina lepadiformis TaxID=159417 RepID=A0ABP0FQ88_CLALP